MKLSLRQRILKYLQAHKGVWVSGDEIEKRAQSVGYKASTGSRRARELAEDGEIHRKEVNGTVFYCYDKVITKKVSTFVPTENGMREVIKEYLL